ncbi:MAG: DUF3574 domain-containing protein [Microvirga sp.]
MRFVALVALAVLPGCVTVAAPPCAGGTTAQLRAELIFGRHLKGGGVVTAAAWRRFVDREITPRFPDGFTVLDGRGQWRKPGEARIVREPSTVLLVAMPDAPERRARLAEVAQAYKRRFAQESVVTLLTPSCVSF